MKIFSEFFLFGWMNPKKFDLPPEILSMKLIRSESSVDYSSYTFNYALYAMYEDGDDFSAIYDHGFLPYTGDVGRKEALFYMARSIRIDLVNFIQSSENRRLMRKVGELNLVSTLQSKDKLIADPNFRTFCQSYIEARIGLDKMPMDRLDYILSTPMTTDILTFSLDGKPIAYILVCLDSKMLHYWFAFFDPNKLTDYPIGKWVMLETILWAQKNERSHVYLGTCYGTKALYKVRDHKAAQWWDGNKWNLDVSKLKQLCKEDETSKPDRLKREQDFLTKFR